MEYLNKIYTLPKRETVVHRDIDFVRINMNPFSYTPISKKVLGNICQQATSTGHKLYITNALFDYEAATPFKITPYTAEDLKKYQKLSTSEAMQYFNELTDINNQDRENFPFDYDPILQILSIIPPNTPFRVQSALLGNDTLIHAVVQSYNQTNKIDLPYSAVFFT